MTTKSPKIIDDPGSKLPRLGIQHLFLWTAISAGLLAFSKSLDYFSTNTDDIPQQAQMMLQGWAAADAVISGAALTGVLVLFRSRNSFSTMMRQPGHWLLFTNSAIALLSWGHQLSYTVEALQSSYLWCRFSPMAFLVAPATIYGFAAACNRGIWRWLFFTAAVLNLSALVGPFLAKQTTIQPALAYSIPFHLSGLLSLAMVSIAAIQAFNGERRDWVHWLGIMTGAVLPLVGYLAWNLASLTGLLRLN